MCVWCGEEGGRGGERGGGGKKGRVEMLKKKKKKKTPWFYACCARVLINRTNEIHDYLIGDFLRGLPLTPMPVLQQTMWLLELPGMVLWTWCRWVGLCLVITYGLLVKAWRAVKPSLKPVLDIFHTINTHDVSIVSSWNSSSWSVWWWWWLIDTNIIFRSAFVVTFFFTGECWCIECVCVCVCVCVRTLNIFRGAFLVTLLGWVLVCWV